MTPNGAAANQLLLFIREFGNSVFNNVVLQTKTKSALDSQVKTLFGVGPYTLTLLSDQVPVTLQTSFSDQDISNLNNGANLEVKFTNKVCFASFFSLDLFFLFFSSYLVFISILLFLIKIFPI